MGWNFQLENQASKKGWKFQPVFRVLKFQSKFKFSNFSAPSWKIRLGMVFRLADVLFLRNHTLRCQMKPARESFRTVFKCLVWTCSSLPNRTPWPLGYYWDRCWHSSIGYLWRLNPGFSLSLFLGYYPALGFCPPLAVIQPLVLSLLPPRLRCWVFPGYPWFFTFVNPWLQFSPWFSHFSPLAVIKPKVFQLQQTTLLVEKKWLGL